MAKLNYLWHLYTISYPTWWYDIGEDDWSQWLSNIWYNDRRG